MFIKNTLETIFLF